MPVVALKDATVVAEAEEGEAGEVTIAAGLYLEVYWYIFLAPQSLALEDSAKTGCHPRLAFLWK